MNPGIGTTLVIAMPLTQPGFAERQIRFSGRRHTAPLLVGSEPSDDHRYTLSGEAPMSRLVWRCGMAAVDTLTSFSGDLDEETRWLKDVTRFVQILI